jgi:hypothetical protein
VKRAVAALLVATALIAGCTSAVASDGGSAADPAAMVTARCTRCHSLQRVKNAHHDTAGWQATIARMQRHGVNLTDREAQALVTFLAAGGAAKL